MPLAGFDKLTSLLRAKRTGYAVQTASVELDTLPSTGTATTGQAPGRMGTTRMRVSIYVAEADHIPIAWNTSRWPRIRIARILGG